MVDPWIDPGCGVDSAGYVLDKPWIAIRMLNAPYKTFNKD